MGAKEETRQNRLLVVSVIMRVFNKKTRIPHFPKWKLIQLHGADEGIQKHRLLQ